MRNNFAGVMTSNVLTVQDVADMLKVCPRTVLNMANKGDIPASRIGHLWRFDESEILNWLKSKTDARAPRKNSLVGGIPSCIMELVSPELIRIEKTVMDKRQVLEDLASLAIRSGRVTDYAALLRSIEEREEMHTTALDEGVAFPHPRRPLSDLEEPLLAVLIVESGVDFGSPAGGKTHIFVLFCAPDDSVHVRLLARLARIFRHQKKLVSRLRRFDEPGQVLRDLIEAEREKSIEGRLSS